MLCFYSVVVFTLTLNTASVAGGMVEQVTAGPPPSAGHGQWEQVGRGFDTLCMVAHPG